MQDISGYTYSDATPAHTMKYLLPCVMRVLEESVKSGREKKVFEIGCGNGAVAEALQLAGYEIRGVDPSHEGVRMANLHRKHLHLELGSTDEDLAGKYGLFPFVLSLEVVEHVFLPRQFARRAYDLLLPEGIAIISTPYHSYFKNLALALSGKMDAHFTALWDYGHIKFWSEATLRQLLIEAGFRKVSFLRVGRIPLLAKSMIAVAEK